MRRLIYWIDASRRTDWNIDHKYKEVLDKYIKESDKALTSYPMYFTTYPSTYRWFLSMMNANKDIETYGYEFCKCQTTGRMPSKVNKFNIKASLSDHKLRISEVNLIGTYQDAIGSKAMMDGYGEFIKIEDLLTDNTDKVIDFVYDICFHDKLMESDDYSDSKLQKSEIYNDSYEVSKILYNKEFFDKYDEVYILSDHGYADFDQKGFWEHNVLGEGNPIHHSAPILYKIDNYSPIKYNRNYVLMDQTDLIDLFIESRVPMKDYIVINGYDAIERRYPLKYYIVYSSGKVIYVNLGLYEYYNNEITMKIYEVDTTSDEFEALKPEPLTQEIWDLLYNESPFVSKIFDYTNYKSRWQ